MSQVIPRIIINTYFFSMLLETYNFETNITFQHKIKFVYQVLLIILLISIISFFSNHIFNSFYSARFFIV